MDRPIFDGAPRLQCMRCCFGFFFFLFLRTTQLFSNVSASTTLHVENAGSWALSQKH